MTAGGLRGKVRNAIEHHPVVAVVLAALVANVAYYALFVTVLAPRLSGLAFMVARYTPITVGPSLAAVTVTWLVGDDVRALVGQVTDWRVSLRWYAVALVVPNALQFADDVAYAATGTQVTVGFDPGGFAFYFLGTLLLAGSLEELGWRGFAQPRLQEHYGATVAAVLVGLAWTLWHLPQVLPGNLGYGSSMSLPLFTLNLVALSVVMAWLYTHAGLVPVLVFHAANNAPAPVLDPVGPAPGWVAANSYLLRTVAGLSVALVLVLAYGHSRLAREGTPPRVRVEGPATDD